LNTLSIYLPLMFISPLQLPIRRCINLSSCTQFVDAFSRLVPPEIPEMNSSAASPKSNIHPASLLVYKTIYRLISSCLEVITRCTDLSSRACPFRRHQPPRAHQP
jgi:hypothetical protein